MEKNILVIESNSACRILMQQVLEDFGVNYHIVKNGTEGLSYYASNAVDLVLLNTQLPDILDIELIKSLKEIKQKPLIAVSARCFPNDIERAIKAGCDYFIKKPIEIDLLLRVIKEHLVK